MSLPPEMNDKSDFKVPKSKDFTHTRALFDLFRNVTLSSAEASLCRWDAGESEHESAQGTMGEKKREGRLPSFPLSIVHCALCYFLIIAIFIGITSGSLGGGERGNVMNYRN